MADEFSDLRVKVKQEVMAVVETAQNNPNKAEGIDAIMQVVDDWVGGTDAIFAMLGHRIPDRPDSAFEGVSDAFLELDPSEMEVTYSLSMLTACNSVKGRILGYADFFWRLKSHLEKTEPDEVDGLIGGLEPEDSGG